jgi:hypothetical protein
LQSIQGRDWFWVFKMFRGSNITGYFSKIGTLKSGPSGASLSGTASGDLDSELVGTQATSIRLSEGASVRGSQNSSTVLREYPTADPRYVHQIEKSVPLRSSQMPHSVCNQPRKRKRSNPAVQLIILACLGVPHGTHVVDLSLPADNGPIELCSDSMDHVSLCANQEEDEVDPDMQEWL